MDEQANRIKTIHDDCHKIIRRSLGKYLPVAGNIGIFCRTEEEFNLMTKLRKEITLPSDNPNQKYFELKEPIVVPASDKIPSATYSHLYIRKPDPTPYGKYDGDIDFIMEPEIYNQLKKTVTQGQIEGALIYDRPSWDTIQITAPDLNSVAYISTKEFSEKVRIKFD